MFSYMNETLEYQLLKHESDRSCNSQICTMVMAVLFIAIVRIVDVTKKTRLASIERLKT